MTHNCTHYMGVCDRLVCEREPIRDALDHMPAPPNYLCPLCSGHGRTTPDRIDVYVTCPRCEGRGYVLTILPTDADEDVAY